MIFYIDQQHMVPVPMMNKIPFFSGISQQMHKMYEKVVQLLKFRTKLNAVLQA